MATRPLPYWVHRGSYGLILPGCFLFPGGFCMLDVISCNMALHKCGIFAVMGLVRTVVAKNITWCASIGFQQ